MDIASLERSLGENYATCIRPENLPPETWRLINQVTPQKKTWLMEAAEVGNVQCVDFLLRCGVDVNASDNEGNRAIDYALEGERENRTEVILMLFRRDSLLPDIKESGKQLRFETLVRKNEGIEKLFVERERFHEFVKKGDETEIEDILKNSVHTSSRQRYWVKRDGRSALYTAGAETKFNAWALLKYRNFNYAGVLEYEVGKKMEIKNRFQFNQALEKYFTPIPNSHVFKMLSRSRVLGCPGSVDKRLLDIYEKVDEEPMTSLLLKCLQDEVNFEVIFDMERINICCMFAGMSAGVRGLTDYAMDRVYASGGETAEYDYSDVVSNLVHELAHKAMHVLFANGGRPYKKEDEENKEKYKQIVSNIMASEGFETFDNILQKVKGYRKQFHSQELIVRVPEIISKYHFKQHGRDWRQIPNTQVKDLFEYYEAQVIPEMENYIKINKTVNMVPTDDFLLSLRSKHKHGSVEVVKSVNKIGEGYQRVLRVSNLKLAISHLEKEYKNIMCVDWRMYERHKDYLISQLVKGEPFTHMAVVWEENCKADNDSFFKIRENVEERCKSNVYLVIPKYVNAPKRFIPVEYTWKDLSVKTKSCLIEKKVVFQGRNVSVRELMQSALRKDNVEDEMDLLLDAKELSCLIDEEKLTIGRPLENALEERGRELLRQHPRCFIPRRTRVRPVELDRGTFKLRARDAFFICNARPRDLEGAGFGKVSEWGEEGIPENCRCFLLKAERDTRNEDDHFETVIKKLKGFPCPGAKEGDKWEFAHFFKYDGGNNYTHIRSCVVHTNQAVIIAGAPGSGKSVIVNMRAQKMKEQSPFQWVEVFELTNHETQIKTWKEDEFTSKEGVHDFLFNLIRGRNTDGINIKNMSLDNNLYKIYTRSRENVIIYFDGFDEICPKYKKKVTLFLKALKNETNVNFTVTTRIQEYAELEKELETISENLIPCCGEEGVELINKQWNAYLQAMEIEEGREKAKNIVSCLQLNNETDDSQEISEIIQKLTSTYVENANEKIKDVDLKYLAEDFIEVGKSAIKGEADFSETPLHSWMLASVAFEDNLNIEESLHYSQLYERFVGIKLSLYSREKAKVSECVADDALIEGFKRSAYLNLKKYSAFLFLGDEEYKLNDKETQEMLRVGLLHQREQSTVFIHRTFVEYFLSLWLLEKARKKKVTRVWKSRILLEREFENVRQFLDSTLLSHYGRGSQGGEGEQGMEFEVYPLNQSALREGEQFVQSMQKFTFTCILECNGGILRYLAENSKESVGDVIFGSARWDVESVNIKIDVFSEIEDWSALTLCGGCIRGKVEMKQSNVTHSTMDYLEFLPTMLRIIEERGLVEKLKRHISRSGLEWTGVNEEKLWKEEEGSEQFKLTIEFLMRNKDALSKTLKERVLKGKGELLLEKSALYAFNIFVYIVESILEEKEFGEGLLKKNVVSAWTGVVRFGDVKGVTRMWEYLKGKLEGVEGGKGRFLMRKDHRQWNALFSLFCGESGVAPFVWKLYREAFPDKESKEILFDSFNGVSESSQFNRNEFLKLLFALLEEGFVDDGEVTLLLLSRNDENKCYMVSFDWPPPFPPTLYRLQHFLLSNRLAANDILTEMNGLYKSLAHSCFGYNPYRPPWDAAFASSVESEWQEVRPSHVIPYPWWFREIECGGNGFLLPQVRGWTGERVRRVRLKAYVVLLERELRMEERTLGREGLFKRIKREWWRIHYGFPEVRRVGRREETRAPLFFFVSLSKFLSKGQVAGILMHSDSFWGTTFHGALNKNDPMGFLALYDVARWCMGDGDALWRVHAVIGRGGRGEKRTVLELLLQKQEEGLFAYINDSENADCSDSDAVPTDWKQKTERLDVMYGMSLEMILELMSKDSENADCSDSNEVPTDWEPNMKRRRLMNRIRNRPPMNQDSEDDDSCDNDPEDDDSCDNDSEDDDSCDNDSEDDDSCDNDSEDDDDDNDNFDSD